MHLQYSSFFGVSFSFPECRDFVVVVVVGGGGGDNIQRREFV